ncbi:MAG: hypothetical protein KJN76_11210 [Eudoraea sp.]|nr:hypothetical protein [Eudoraea sp.]
MRKIIVLLLVIICSHSCQIQEEITFNKNGSGTYQMAFDMSEMMKMGDLNDTLRFEPPVDSLVSFASFLDEKKDSIAQLPKKEREALETLRPLKFAMNMNEAEKQMKINLIYDFEKFEDISQFAQALEKANIKELKQLDNPMSGLNGEADLDSTDQDNGFSEVFSMAKQFKTSFSKKKFSRTITKEAREEAIAKKDTTIHKDDPFVDMIRFKQVYRFPYKVKSVSNKNARILSDFKGVEIEANMYDMNNDPEFFNVVVVFER